METSFRDNSSSLHAENGGLNLTKLELEWRLFGVVGLLIAFTTLAYLRLGSTISYDAAKKRRGIVKQTSKEELAKVRAKWAEIVLTKNTKSTKKENGKDSLKSRKFRSVPEVDTEAIDHVELAPRGELMKCYSASCKDGSGGCYSPSCPQGKQLLVPADARVEKPYEMKHPKRERRMSLFSQILAHPCGAFPTKSRIAPTTVHSLFYLASLPTKTQLKNLLESRLLSRYHRFSSIPIESPDHTISWQPYEKVDLDAHIIQKTITSEDDAATYVQSLFGRVWDSTKPLWQVHLLQNTAGGNSAIVFELHHVMGDGLSQMQILGDFVTDKEGRPLTLDEKKFKKMTESKRKVKKSVVTKVVEKVGFGVSTGKAVLKVLSLPTIGGDSETVLKTPPEKFSSNNRHLVLLPPVSLPLVKKIKDTLQVTVNDVLLAALAGTVRRYLHHRSDDSLASNPKIRALMPYSFPRPLDDLHNKWTLISAQLPVGQSTPLERIQTAKRNMDQIKKSPEPYIASTIQQALFRAVGHELSSQANLDIFSKHTMVFTNVPGFQDTIYICGHEVKGMQPVVANALMQVSCVSYDGGIWMNFVVEESVVEFERLRGFFVAEMECLRDAAGVEGDVILQRE